MNYDGDPLPLHFWEDVKNRSENMDLDRNFFLKLQVYLDLDLFACQDYLNKSAPPPLKNDATLPVWWRKGVFVIHTNTPRRSQVVM